MCAWRCRCMVVWAGKRYGREGVKRDIVTRNVAYDPNAPTDKWMGREWSGERIGGGIRQRR